MDEREEVERLVENLKTGNFEAMKRDLERAKRERHRETVEQAFAHEFPRLAVAVREINANLVRLQQTVKMAAWAVGVLLFLLLMHLW